MSDRALELIAHRFKILSEPMRLRLLQQLMNGEMSVNELVGLVNTTQANISKHLGILSTAGLVSRRKVGVSILYRIADTSLFTICDLVCRSLQEQGAEVMHSLQNTHEQSEVIKDMGATAEPNPT